MSYFILRKQKQKVMIKMCEERELFKQLGIGFQGDFIGTVDGIGKTFCKNGILYKNVCLTRVHRDGNRKDTPVEHVWIDILESDIIRTNIEKGDVIVVFGVVEEYTRKDGTPGIGLRTHIIKRVVSKRKGNVNDKFKNNSKTSGNCNRTNQSNKKRSRG